MVIRKIISSSQLQKASQIMVIIRHLNSNSNNYLCLCCSISNSSCYRVNSNNSKIKYSHNKDNSIHSSNANNNRNNNHNLFRCLIALSNHYHSLTYKLVNIKHHSLSQASSNNKCSCYSSTSNSSYKLPSNNNNTSHINNNPPIQSHNSSLTPHKQPIACSIPSIQRKQTYFKLISAHPLILHTKVHTSHPHMSFCSAVHSSHQIC